MQVDPNDKQGGKRYQKLLEKQESILDETNKELLDDDSLKEVEELPDKLEAYKKKFMKIDYDGVGEIDVMKLKRMLEEMDIAKTHLEVVKMIREVSKTKDEVITYRDFIDMMLGTKNSVLKLIIRFEELAKEKTKVNTGPPPPKSFADLP